MAYTRKVNYSATGRYGCGPMHENDVYTIEEFVQACECGAFIDYDGWGYPVKNNFADDSIVIQPSNLSAIPKDATHIDWYNR